jgi:hypothetical protein
VRPAILSNLPWERPKMLERSGAKRPATNSAGCQHKRASFVQPVTSIKMSRVKPKLSGGKPGGCRCVLDQPRPGSEENFSYTEFYE